MYYDDQTKYCVGARVKQRTMDTTPEQDRNSDNIKDSARG